MATVCGVQLLAMSSNSSCHKIYETASSGAVKDDGFLDFVILSFFYGFCLFSQINDLLQFRNFNNFHLLLILHKALHTYAYCIFAYTYTYVISVM